MTLRDLLRKKDKIEERSAALSQGQEQDSLAPPPFKIYRSDTNTEELINPPSFASDKDLPLPSGATGAPQQQQPPSSSIRGTLGRLGSFSRSSERDGSDQKDQKRLSQRLHLSMNRNRSSSANSSNLPSDLPDIPDAYSPRGDRTEKEAEWEQRATILASSNRPKTPTTPDAPSADMAQLNVESPRGRRRASDRESDVNIQNAIKLHEEGKLEEAAHMFKQLADDGNVISQVLYGLSLRHGWGVPIDEPRAFGYLSSAASNSASLEAEALKAGLKKGGAAKGEHSHSLFPCFC